MSELQEEIEIYDFIRLNLKAEHVPTGTIVTFPLIHFLIEKVKDGYFATCLEYSQCYQSEKPEDAVIGLMNYMYRYFLSVIKEKGEEAIYQQAASEENNNLWNQIRKYSAKKHSLDLKFVEKSFRNEDLSDLKNALSNRREDKYISEKDHNEIVGQMNDLLDTIFKAYNDQQKQLDEYKHKFKQLHYGLEAADEWKQEISKDDISRSTLITAGR